MKKGTALFMALTMIVGIVSGGVVFFSVAYAEETSDYFISIPIGGDSDPYTPIGTNIGARSYDAPNLICGHIYTGGYYRYRFVTNSPDGMGKYFILSPGGPYQIDDEIEYNGHTYYYRSVVKDNSPIKNTISSDEIFWNLVDLYFYPVTTTNTYSFTLESGSVAYIEYANQDIDLHMDTVMPGLSTVWIAGNQPNFWPSSLTYIGNVNALPVINDTLNFSNWDSISWDRGEPRNILGQTKNAIYSDTVFYGGQRYLTVYNYPYYLTNLDKAEAELNGAINITVTNAVSVTVYSALSGTINGVTNTIISNDGDNVSTDGQYTNQEGQIVTPTPGSGNFIPENSDLESVLTNLVSNIDTFFTGTWRHIRQLVTSAGKLPSVIVEMYSWLPEEYKGVLFSAFGIVIVVGILKVML